MLTLAPGTAAPDPSATVPVTLPYSDCAAAADGCNAIAEASAEVMTVPTRRRTYFPPKRLSSVTGVLLTKKRKRSARGCDGPCRLRRRGLTRESGVSTRSVRVPGQQWLDRGTPDPLGSRAICGALPTVG